MDREAIETVFRRQRAEALATLIRLVGAFDLAEEGLQEAFAAAIVAWPRAAPDNPKAWLVAVARRKAVDQLRRRIAFRAHAEVLESLARIEAQAVAEPVGDEWGDDDDLLRLIFTCCHPALSLEAQVALTLRSVCGLTTEAVARAFLLSPEAMAQRLVRAKRKIRLAAIPYRVPPVDQLDERLEGVLAALYLVFTDAYAGDPRASLAGEAIALGRRLLVLLPGRRATAGLLALMLLHEARAPARIDAAGDIVLLEDQDRSTWNQGAIAEGLALVETALAGGGPPSPYAVQAAIGALHARAPSFEATDWRQIVGLYDVLIRLNPSPVLELNRAAALAMTGGPAAALERIEALAAGGALADYPPLFAARAELLRRLGRGRDAHGAFRQALALARSEPERRLYRRRVAELAGSAAGSRRVALPTRRSGETLLGS